MAQITGGFVAVEDGVKKAEEYSVPRKVRVELKFDIAEGTAPEGFKHLFDYVGQQASSKVAELLGKAPEIVEVRLENDEGGAIGRVVPPPAPAARRTRRTKAQIEADEAARRAAEAAANKPEDDGTGLPADEPTDELPADLEADLEDDEFALPPVDPPKTVSDADLTSAVGRKNGELKNPQLIRKLIAEYRTDPNKEFILRDIPQDKRPEFLDRLAKLTADAA